MTRAERKAKLEEAEVFTQDPNWSERWTIKGRRDKAGRFHPIEIVLGDFGDFAGGLPSEERDRFAERYTVEQFKIFYEGVLYEYKKLEPYVRELVEIKRKSRELARSEASPQPTGQCPEKLVQPLWRIAVETPKTKRGFIKVSRFSHRVRELYPNGINRRKFDDKFCKIILNELLDRNQQKPFRIPILRRKTRK
jgi:hypothetical protein